MHTGVLFNYQNVSVATVGFAASAVLCIVPSVGSIVASDMPRTITAWCWASGSKQTNKQTKREQIIHITDIKLLFHIDLINYVYIESV